MPSGEHDSQGNWAAGVVHSYSKCRPGWRWLHRRKPNIARVLQSQPNLRRSAFHGNAPCALRAVQLFGGWERATRGKEESFRPERRQRITGILQNGVGHEMRMSTRCATRL